MKKLTVSATLAMGIATSAIADENPYQLWDSIPRLIERQTETYVKAMTDCAPSVSYAVDETEITPDDAIACSDALINNFIVVDQTLGHALYEIEPQNDSQEQILNTMKIVLQGNCKDRQQELVNHLNSLGDSASEKIESASLKNEFVFACYQGALIDINGELSEVFGLSLFPHNNLQDIYDTTFCQGVVVPQSSSAQASDLEQCYARFRAPRGQGL